MIAVKKEMKKKTNQNYKGAADLWCFQTQIKRSKNVSMRSSDRFDSDRDQNSFYNLTESHLTVASNYP